MKGPVKDRVRPYGMARARFFPTLGVAVKEYLRRTGLEWHHWEEEPEAGGSDPPAPCS